MKIIDKKIVKVEVVSPTPAPEATSPTPRPSILSGRTYKIKSPLYEHSFYVTINDVDERPFELFIHSKNMEQFQWITALTRVIAAVFRTSPDLSFLIEELHSVFDPKGGYWNQGRFIPSLVSEIGDVIELHVRRSEGSHAVGAPPPERPIQCPKCFQYTVTRAGGCTLCSSCGDSKCE